MPESDFEAKKPSEQDKKGFQNIYANHPETIVNERFGFLQFWEFYRVETTMFNARKQFWGQKTFKTGQKHISKYLRTSP